jgi:hypothetical protein
LCEDTAVSDEPHLHVGDRVVVHDSNPPYDYRSGAIEGVEQQHGAAVTYTVALDEGDVLQPTAELIHRMPLDPADACPFCSARLEHPPEP